MKAVRDGSRFNLWISAVICPAVLCRAFWLPSDHGDRRRQLFLDIPLRGLVSDTWAALLWPLRPADYFLAHHVADRRARQLGVRKIDRRINLPPDPRDRPAGHLRSQPWRVVATSRGRRGASPERPAHREKDSVKVDRARRIRRASVCAQAAPIADEPTLFWT
jgi:hypothetical protein